MYELRTTTFGSHTRYDLHNSKTGNGFSIVPACGANVLDIQIGGQSILDGYQTPEELEAGKWGKSTILFPFPNRLAGGKYTWNGKKYEFPINNAATGNAIHGFVRAEAFEIEHIFLSQNAASIRCFYEYAGDRAYYPFPFSLEVEFLIFDDGNFHMEIEVDNLGETDMPFGFGWHPYFRLARKADGHSLKLPNCAMVDINEAMIPTGKTAPFTDFHALKQVGETALDNCFLHAQTSGSPKMTLSGPDLTLTVKAPVKEFPYFQVFTPPHRESIALEPMTCNVDVFNNKQGLVVLESGGNWQGKVEMTFE